MKQLVWFGSFTFGSFTIGDDTNPMAIVNSIDHVARMSICEAEDYMTENGYDTYLFPRWYDGEIVFAQNNETLEEV